MLMVLMGICNHNNNNFQREHPIKFELHPEEFYYREYNKLSLTQALCLFFTGTALG